TPTCSFQVPTEDIPTSPKKSPGPAISRAAPTAYGGSQVICITKQIFSTIGSGVAVSCGVSHRRSSESTYKLTAKVLFSSNGRHGCRTRAQVTEKQVKLANLSNGKTSSSGSLRLVMLSKVLSHKANHTPYVIYNLTYGKNEENERKKRFYFPVLSWKKTSYNKKKTVSALLKPLSDKQSGGRIYQNVQHAKISLKKILILVKDNFKNAYTSAIINGNDSHIASLSKEKPKNNKIPLSKD
uniref:Uncharacterized protein n=1 Tax=Sus scrofa TaxID=9823 RepID=A0A8D0RNB3_PIG